PITADVFVFASLLLFRKTGKTLVWAAFFFLNPLAIFSSSVTGHYDSAVMFLVVVGCIWFFEGRTIRAGFIFFVSSLLQFLGLIPYFLIIIRSSVEKRYRLSLGLASIGLLTFAYGPQREVSYRIILSVLGLTNSPQFSAGSYTLIGSLGLTSYVTEA